MALKRWTLAEVEQLRVLALQNVSPHDIAAKLGRSVASVQTKAWAEGITLRSNGRASNGRPGTS